MSNQAAWAVVFLAAGDKALFWVVCNKGRKNGEDAPNKIISASHFDSILPGCNEWL